jgi:hypothetical protein
MSLIPYGPDFTPTTLGRKIGKDRVLSYLLEHVSQHGSGQSLARAIVEDCLEHVGGKTPEKARRNRRDMASHVVQALQNYGLAQAKDDKLTLTEVGQQLLAAADADRDRLFARHILRSCNGLKLILTVRELEFRDQTPSLEALAEILEGTRTSKSISSMKAWLERAGIFSGRGYQVDDDKLEEVQGLDVEPLLRLNAEDASFLVAAVVASIESGSEELIALQVADLAERRTEIKIPRKPLGTMVKRLEAKGLVVEILPRAKGVGGTRTRFKLTKQVRELKEKELESLLMQGSEGFVLSGLPSLPEIYQDIGSPDKYTAGKAGEMLACHIALILGLQVRGWRKKVPYSEIDLVADRTIALSYQRWFVQVKNVQQNVDVDRVDREIGAATGIGATHVLFVAPRSRLSNVARKQISLKSRLTSLHVYFLDSSSLAEDQPLSRILDELRDQEKSLARLKREEAEQRESQKR